MSPTTGAATRAWTNRNPPGGGDFYDRVYNAARRNSSSKPPHSRVVGPDQPVAIRSDATWSVPEPELTLLITPRGNITGYTIGNDMSSRDIEGENPVYLPQAKVYNRSCALGPCDFVTDKPLPKSTEISLEIRRHGESTFAGSTTLNSLKREPSSLVEFLYRDNSFPDGCFLLTGTGIVPPDSFTLQHGDEVRITVPPIGTLVNVSRLKPSGLSRFVQGQAFLAADDLFDTHAIIALHRRQFRRGPRSFHVRSNRHTPRRSGPTQ